MNGTNGNEPGYPEKALVPYPVILAATTEHKIGKVTYLVCSSASERATDTLDKKIKKLIRKDMELNPANARK